MKEQQKELTADLTKQKREFDDYKVHGEKELVAREKIVESKENELKAFDVVRENLDKDIVSAKKLSKSAEKDKKDAEGLKIDLSEKKEEAEKTIELYNAKLKELEV